VLLLPIDFILTQEDLLHYFEYIIGALDNYALLAGELYGHGMHFRFSGNKCRNFLDWKTHPRPLSSFLGRKRGVWKKEMVLRIGILYSYLLMIYYSPIIIENWKGW
jgi:hypothetical protein